MGYYQDKDEELGVDQEVDEYLRYLDAQKSKKTKPKPQRGTKIWVICKCGCGRKKLVRVADVKRGWGRYYSKSCKARDQARRDERARP